MVLQSGLDDEWLADATECYCYLRNVTDLWSDGKTPYERRFGMPFNGPVIPFEAMVEYHTISAKDQSRLQCVRGSIVCQLDCVLRPIWTASVWSKSLARYTSRPCIVRGRSLERRHYGRRH